MNRKWSFTLMSALIVTLLLSACTNAQSTTASLKPTSTASPQPTVLPTTTAKPSFQIEGIHNGDVVAPGDVALQVLLSNFTLVDFNASQDPQPGEGHIHYWLDTNPTDPKAAVQVAQDPEHIVLPNVKAGEHILTVKLVGTDHKPISETTTQIITFMAKRSSGTAAANSPTPKAIINPSPKASTKPATATASPKPTSKPAATIKPSPTTNTANASFKIIGLKNGDIITSKDLKFQISLSHFTLIDSSINDIAPLDGEGHIHIWLDTTSIEEKAAYKVYTDPKHIVIKNIAPGEHSILVGLISNDHKTIIGPRLSVKFTVKH